MGVKYRLPYKTIDEVSWHVDIDVPLYANEPVILVGVKDAAAVIDYDGETDDPYTVLFKSSLTSQFYNQGQVDVNELMQAQDRQIIVTLYRENDVRFKGYLDPNSVQEPLKSVPYEVSIKALDGLDFLEDIPYAHADLYAFTETGSARCPLNYFRQILNSPANLGLALPIRWSNNLECTAFPDEDVFAGEVTWAAKGEGFYSYQSGQDDNKGPTKSCAYILEGMLRSMGCHIKQVRGRWTIRRVNYISGNSNVIYRQVPADMGIVSIQSGTENLLNKIGLNGYRMVQEDHILTNKPGIKSCKVVYNANVRENILPNGNQDYRNPDQAQHLLYWDGYTGTDPTSINAVPGLDGRDGLAVELLNGPFQTYYSLKAPAGTLYENGLPINTKTLVPRVSFGFTFSPQNGFPFDVSTQLIDWSSNPFLIQVIFNSGSTRYYLNEFGFWTTDITNISITVDQLKINDIARVDFDRFQGILMPATASDPVAGDTSDIKILFGLKAGQKYTLDNIYLTIDQANDVYESTEADSLNTLVDERELDISSSFSGYMLSNFMSGWYASDTECFFRDGAIYEGTLTGLLANAIMRYRHKPSKVFNGSISTRKLDWSFDEIYNIDSQEMRKFLPLNASYNTEKCEVSLVAMECRNDNAIFTEKYYSSNDQTLSN